MTDQATASFNNESRIFNLKSVWTFTGISELTENYLKKTSKYLSPCARTITPMEEQIPELEAEIDFLKIQYLSSDTVMTEAKDCITTGFNYHLKRNVL